MGLLVDGVWKDKWYDTKSTGGKFVRKESSFRNWITADGSAGPTGDSGFKAEADRYHLFVSYACPWAHRTLVFRKLKKLEDLIPVTAVQALMLENGWEFPEIEPLTGAKYAWHVYTKADPGYSGRATVPILWDKKQNTIVSNESSEIIRMFNSAFNDLTGSQLDFYPSALRGEIDSINERVYDAINNGVYKSGFATTQEAYEEAVTELFTALDEVEDRLSRQRYLVGDRMTEADWRLFTTLLRFDAVYFGHFKCNIRRIEDYPNLSNYLRELYQVPEVSDTVDMETIKKHYYGSHETVNPTRIVPVGPELDFTRPHDRERFKAAA
ncbi:glutathione S-transferase family protein [Stappia sp. BW2]|jgi:putative glutathione S-transferase|uniref:glutathione S-transferase family protein n=1 Tax=Stappia sp. BW2 TaxID=2592622 RepID=UPI0011DE9E95|nr:glutathione S-transferase family protein [Stappia sp. BW2]TYC64574.1 glutathione S-transferase family protein [Stappia sp. BW2]